MIDVGLLILRVMSAGFMLGAHGWGKLMKFSMIAPNFPDPLGVGGPISLGLAVFAEFFCAILVIVGFKTRWFAIPLAITMLVAALIVHAGDPFAKKEFALIYFIPFFALIFTGGGKFSVDGFLGND